MGASKGWLRKFFARFPHVKSPILSWSRRTVAKRLDEQGEGWRGLAAARVIEMIARIGRAPILKHALQATLHEMRRGDVLGHIGQPEAGQRRIEHLERAVEDELAFDMHLQLAAVVFEFPSI